MTAFACQYNYFYDKDYMYDHTPVHCMQTVLKPTAEIFGVTYIRGTLGQQLSVVIIIIIHSSVKPTTPTTPPPGEGLSVKGVGMLVISFKGVN